MPKDKPPTGSLYPRESYVCFFVFLIELAAVRQISLFYSIYSLHDIWVLQVWSMVAMIYLLFANYLPTSDEKNFGLLEQPAMCTTTRNIGLQGTY